MGRRIDAPQTEARRDGRESYLGNEFKYLAVSGLPPATTSTPFSILSTPQSSGPARL